MNSLFNTFPSLMYIGIKTEHTNDIQIISKNEQFSLYFDDEFTKAPQKFLSIINEIKLGTETNVMYKNVYNSTHMFVISKIQNKELFLEVENIVLKYIFEIQQLENSSLLKELISPLNDLLHFAPENKETQNAIKKLSTLIIGTLHVLNQQTVLKQTNFRYLTQQLSDILDLTIEVDDDVPEFISTDSTKFTHAFINLFTAQTFHAHHIKCSFENAHIIIYADLKFEKVEKKIYDINYEDNSIIVNITQKILRTINCSIENGSILMKFV